MSEEKLHNVTSHKIAGVLTCSRSSQTWYDSYHSTFWMGQNALQHGVSKSLKKYHSTWRAKRAMFTFWVDKSSWKMPKNETFQWKIQMRHFWVIFQHCEPEERFESFPFVWMGDLKLVSSHTFECLDAIYACHTPDQLSWNGDDLVAIRQGAPSAPGSSRRRSLAATLHK